MSEEGEGGGGRRSAPLLPFAPGEAAPVPAGAAPSELTGCVCPGVLEPFGGVWGGCEGGWDPAGLSRPPPALLMFFFSKGNCRRLSWRGPPVWRPGACGGAEGRSAGFGKGVWAARLPSPYPALFLPAEPPFVREQQKSVRRFRVSAWCRLNPAP